MRCLITGGCGFIGSHLAKHVLPIYDEIRILDDMSEGNMYAPPFADNIVVTEGDINDERMEFLYKDVEIVYHLAALTRPQKSIVDIENYHRVNVDGTLNVLESCRRNGVKRLVFASSAAIYGNQNVFPTPESALPDIMNPYAAQKVMGETYCNLYDRLYGVETNCLRLFNVYGTGMNPNGEYAAVIPKFVAALRAGKVPVIYGNGYQSRDFVNVGDVVRAFYLSAHMPTHGQVFNIGNGNTFNINEIYRRISGIMLVDKNAEHGSAILEPATTWADIAKAKKYLGWECEVDLVTGLTEIINGGY